MRFTVSRYGLVCLAVCALSATMASAQTASTLLGFPWRDDETARLYVGSWMQPKGEAKQSGQDVRLTQSIAYARWLLDADNPYQPAVGISYSQLNTHSDDALIPDQLVDVNVAGSMVFDLEEDQTLQVILGGGYAGDSHFGDGQAYYGMAGLVLTQPIDEESGIKYLITYDGNRSVFPDIPLPGFAYYGVLNEVFYAVGFPVNTITVSNDSGLQMQVNYIIPQTFNASITQELVDGWAVFTAYDRRSNPYTLEDDPDDRRTIFSQQRVEAGFTWDGDENSRLPGVKVTIAGGYAFDQEFSRGWDARSDDTIRDISDEPFLRFLLRMRF